MPFENQSGSPGLEWIGESFPELLGERLNSPSIFVVSREDRLRAYDRLGIPAGVHPSRATLYRVAEQLDVEYVVMGGYAFDGRTFTATAQLLDMRKEHLQPEASESGPLIQLIDIQTRLAWNLLKELHAGLAMSREAYVAAAPAIRLDAFENYVRGSIASDSQDRIRRFREALRLNPEYPEAALKLGKTYYADRQYDQAIAYLGRVPLEHPLARQANFYLGLAAYYRGDFARAETAFGFVASRLPLGEVYNNLGVVEARRGNRNAAEYFEMALRADPSDPDYHFNLAVTLFRNDDLAGASRQAREALNLRPADAEAKALADQISSQAMARVQGSAAGPAKAPMERIRQNYEENSFRQLALSLNAAAEQRLATAEPRVHAQFHVDRGHELLTQGFVLEATREFREAVSLDSANAGAHAGLARALESSDDLAGARAEAQAALTLRQFAEPWLVLARLDLRDNRTETAAEEADRALRLEPGNGEAQALKRTIAAKLAEKAQPLPNR